MMEFVNGKDDIPYNYYGKNMFQNHQPDLVHTYEGTLSHTRGTFFFSAPMGWSSKILIASGTWQGQLTTMIFLNYSGTTINGKTMVITI